MEWFAQTFSERFYSDGIDRHFVSDERGFRNVAFVDRLIEDACECRLDGIHSYLGHALSLPPVTNWDVLCF
jgi:hypothetical protein